MKLWKISQKERNYYDTYDSAVVAAETEEMARNINPACDGWHSDAWCSGPEKVTVVLLGEAKDGTVAGAIVSSYNAG